MYVCVCVSTFQYQCFSVHNFLHVCLYVCMYVCVCCKYQCFNVHNFLHGFICMYVCMCLCVCKYALSISVVTLIPSCIVCMYVCIYLCVCFKYPCCNFLHALYMYVCMYVYLHTYTHICMYIYIYIYICIYVYTYIHTHWHICMCILGPWPYIIHTLKALTLNGIMRRACSSSSVSSHEYIICMHATVCVCRHVCMYIACTCVLRRMFRVMNTLYACMPVCVYIYIYTYIHIYIYIVCMR